MMNVVCRDPNSWDTSASDPLNRFGVLRPNVSGPDGGGPFGGVCVFYEVPSYELVGDG